MIPNKKRTNVHITDKLKQAVTNLSVDIFGIEPKIQQSILEYLERISTTTTLPKEQLMVRIFRTSVIRSGIYHQGKLIREIPVQELIAIFTPMQTEVPESLHQNVIKGIFSFFDAVSNAHHVAVLRIHICIDIHQETPRIRAFDRTSFLEEIPLKTLIKHFR